MPTDAWLQWDKERKSCAAFLKKLRECKAMGGKKWRDSMKKHYGARLKELNADEPEQYRIP
jgi:hypothetical protein